MALHVRSTQNVLDTPSLELFGPFGTTTAFVAGTPYVFVAAGNDNGVSVFAVAPGGTLTNVANVSDNATLELASPNSVTTAVVGSATYLFVAAGNDDGVSVFWVGPNGTLDNVHNVTDDPTLELDNAGGLATAVVGGTTYLFATGFFDDGVSVFRVEPSGTLTNVHNVTDNATLEIDGAAEAATAVVGGTTYLFVTGGFDNGLSVFSVAPNGTLTNVDNVTDSPTRALDGAGGVTSAVIGGTTYLFVTGVNDDGVSVFSVAPNGTLTHVQTVTDDATLEIDGPGGVTMTVIGGTTYLIVAGVHDSGFSMFSVAADGTLANVANVADAGPLQLSATGPVSTVDIGGITYLFGIGGLDAGISVFAVDGPVPSLGDVLWQHSDGTVATAAAELGTVAATWEVGATGDFDADGDADVLWRHQEGAVVGWEMDNGQLAATSSIGFASTGWEIVGAGDFDADGDDDVLWRHQDGAVVTWEMENGAYVQNHNIEFASTGWTIQGLGDFDADGDDDIIWRHHDGLVVTWVMEDGAYVQNNNIEFASTGWTIQGTGDFNGDGDDDILWRHQDGAVVTWEMEGGDYTRNNNIAFASTGWSIQGTADFNHDGTDDTLWRHTDGEVVTWQMRDAGLLGTQDFGVLGSGWQVRGTGEFDLL